MTNGSGEHPATATLAADADVFDREHRALIARVARFVSDPDGGRPGEVLDVLHFLGMYVDEHMRSEEVVMRAAGFPETDAHIGEHDVFRATFAGIVKSFARYGEDPRVMSRVHHEIFGWLEVHFRTSDRRLGEFLCERAAPDAACGE
jgi:hemerythrin